MFVYIISDNMLRYYIRYIIGSYFQKVIPSSISFDNYNKISGRFVREYDIATQKHYEVKCFNPCFSGSCIQIPQLFPVFGLKKAIKPPFSALGFLLHNY